MPTSDNPPLDQLRAYVAEIKEKDDIALEQATAGWHPGTQYHRVCIREIQRRARRPVRIEAWTAIIISVAALIVAILK